MPSIEHPNYFDRAAFESPMRAGEFLASLSADREALDTTGSVQSPMGHISLVHVTGPQIASYVSAAGDPWMSESRNFAAGWYLLRVHTPKNSHKAFIDGLGYDTEEAARADFAEAVETYKAWEALGYPQH